MFLSVDPGEIISLLQYLLLVYVIFSSKTMKTYVNPTVFQFFMFE